MPQPIDRRFALWVTVLVCLHAAPALAGSPASQPAYEMALEDAWIVMPDGVRLAADLYVPAGVEPARQFPVLLEYLPYRKTEGRGRNWSLYSYFVERGYVVARVDIRGTGNSEGRLIAYEYTDQEHEDGEAVIDWLSKHPLSNGNVGMFGISWGGFNSIQMAMRNPPALKAILAIDATDDLYQDDVHFMDGILHVDSWEMSQDLDNARPGAPDFVIDEALLPRSLRHRAVDDDLQAPAARRAVLGPHGPEGPIRVDSRADVRHRRLVRRLSRQRAAHARAPRGADQGDCRPLVACLSRTTRIPTRAWSGGTRRCAGSTTG